MQHMYRDLFSVYRFFVVECICVYVFGENLNFE
jgi:hypothetical protein